MEHQTRAGLIVLFVIGLIFAVFCLCTPPLVHAQSVDLIWTAPGDDGDVGRAAAYEMRYSRTAMTTDTLGWWNAANVIGPPTQAALPAPSSAGQSDSTHVNLGLYDQPYTFLMRTRDEAFNWSGWSNVLVLTVTLPDVIPPGRVKNMRKK